MKKLLFGYCVVMIVAVCTYNKTSLDWEEQYWKDKIQWEKNNEKYKHGDLYLIPAGNSGYYCITEGFDCQVIHYDVTSMHKPNPYPELAPYMINK